MSKTQISTGTSWFKSSFSRDAASCVEVSFMGETVRIRDSKYLRDPANDPAAQPIIVVRADQWDRFLQLAAGHPAAALPGLPVIERHPDGGATIRSEDGTSLSYTPSEWAAYVAGIQVGEFAAA